MTLGHLQGALEIQGDVIKVNLGVDKVLWKVYDRNQDLLKESLVVTSTAT